MGRFKPEQSGMINFATVKSTQFTEQETQFAITLNVLDMLIRALGNVYSSLSGI